MPKLLCPAFLEDPDNGLSGPLHMLLAQLQPELKQLQSHLAVSPAFRNIRGAGSRLSAKEARESALRANDQWLAKPA